jgi:hypothetical protein
MSPFRYRDEESKSDSFLFLTAGALAGFAAGVLVAQRFGGLRGLTTKLRESLNGAALTEDGEELFEDEFDDEAEEYEEILTPGEDLEERVLEAFNHDPILSGRAVDIGAISEGIIELTGWVHSADEATHAVTITRGTPGVDTVVNRLSIRPEEETMAENAQGYSDGDPALTERQWEGFQAPAGRPRHGNSSMQGRTPDVRSERSERWQGEEASTRDAAEDIEGIAERRQPKGTRPRGGRTDGSPVAPTGVPKADHVASPEADQGNTLAD